MTTTFENSNADYVRFATQTVDTFLAENGRLPSMDFVMTHLRHTSVLFGHQHPQRGAFAVVAGDLRARFPALDPGPSEIMPPARPVLVEARGNGFSPVLMPVAAVALP